MPRGAFEVLSPLELAARNRFDLEYICRQQVQPVYLGEREAVCRVLGRFKFFVDTRDHGFGVNLLLDGFWEMWLTMVLARVVRAGMTVVDIGANYGYYAVLAGDLVGPKGRVVAVEPNPAARATMERTLALNGLTGRTRVVAAAAAATNTGGAYLFAPHNEPKNARIIRRPIEANLREGTLTQVPRWSLDGDASAGRIDVIKIDAEGAEQEILAGMRRTLARDRPVLVLEYNPLRYAEPARILDDLLAVYGTIHAITFEGTLVPVTRERLLAGNDGEDWMLFFGREPAVAMAPERRPKMRPVM